MTEDNKDTKDIETEIAETAEKKPKQFLLMLDEMGIAFMSKLMPTMKYIEVEGMIVEGNDKHQFLVNPNNAPKE